MVRKEPKVCGVADKNYPEGLKRIRKNEKEFCSRIKNKIICNYWI